MGRVSCCTGGVCGNQGKLLMMLGMTGSFMIVELVVGNTTNSMALVADSFHMLSDVIAIIIAYVSVRMSPKRWKKNTYGWARAEVVGALVNAVFLFALCFSIFVEAIKRFMVIEPLKNPQLILLVGGVGLAINLVGLFIFGHHGHSHEDAEGGSDGHGHSHEPIGHGNSHGVHHKEKSTEAYKAKNGKTKGMSGEQMNISGVFLHVMADALGSVVVIISALVIWLTDWEYRDYMDPVLSLLIVVLICCSSWPLLKESTLVLLNSIPAHIDLREVEKGLISNMQVTSVHELHVWRLVGSRVVASCHLEVTRPGPEVTSADHHMTISRQIKEFFHSQGIHSTTIQLEYTNTLEHRIEECQVTCPQSKNSNDGSVSPTCIDSSCCRWRGGKTGVQFKAEA